MQQFIDSNLGQYSLQQEDWWNAETNLEPNAVPDIDSVKEEL